MFRIMENSVRLRRLNNSLMLDLIGDSVNPIEFDIYLANIKRIKNCEKLYVNLANLHEINNDVLSMFKKMHMTLKNKKICLINVSAMNNTILNLFEIDKMFQLYMNKYDAIEGKRPIINRKFKIVS